MTNKYECNKHSWPTPGVLSTAYRCPACAMDTVMRETKGKAKRGLSRSGNSDVRLTGSAGVELRKQVRERDRYHCRHCNTPVQRGEVDHIIALDNGGTDAMSNMQLLCNECHRIKSAEDAGQRVRTGWRNGNPTNPGHHWNKG